MMYEEGSISQEEMKNNVKRNIIFPVLGNVAADPTIVIEELDGGLQYGDIFLLCTDGLSDYLSPIDIEEILDLPKSLPNNSGSCGKSALKATPYKAGLTAKFLCNLTAHLPHNFCAALPKRRRKWIHQ